MQPLLTDGIRLPAALWRCLVSSDGGQDTRREAEAPSLCTDAAEAQQWVETRVPRRDTGLGLGDLAQARRSETALCPPLCSHLWPETSTSGPSSASKEASSPTSPPHPWQAAIFVKNRRSPGQR